MKDKDEIISDIQHTVSILKQQNYTLESKCEELEARIELALRELAHIEGEKTPTEKRVEQALLCKEIKKG